LWSHFLLLMVTLFPDSEFMLDQPKADVQVRVGGRVVLKYRVSCS
jgi:hypothetical protein